MSHRGSSRKASKTRRSARSELVVGQSTLPPTLSVMCRVLRLEMGTLGVTPRRGSSWRGYVDQRVVRAMPSASVFTRRRASHVRRGTGSAVLLPLGPQFAISDGDETPETACAVGARHYPNLVIIPADKAQLHRSATASIGRASSSRHFRGPGAAGARGRWLLSRPPAPATSARPPAASTVRT